MITTWIKNCFSNSDFDSTRELATETKEIKEKTHPLFHYNATINHRGYFNKKYFLVDSDNEKRLHLFKTMLSPQKQTFTIVDETNHDAYKDNQPRSNSCFEYEMETPAICMDKYDARGDKIKDDVENVRRDFIKCIETYHNSLLFSDYYKYVSNAVFIGDDHLCCRPFGNMGGFFLAYFNNTAWKKIDRESKENTIQKEFHYNGTIRNQSWVDLDETKRLNLYKSMLDTKQQSLVILDETNYNVKRNNIPQSDDCIRYEIQTPATSIEKCNLVGWTLQKQPQNIQQDFLKCVYDHYDQFFDQSFDHGYGSLKGSVYLDVPPYPKNLFLYCNPNQNGGDFFRAYFEVKSWRKIQSAKCPL